MTKKDYIMVAGFFSDRIASARQSGDETTVQALQGVAKELCPVFKKDNSNFDKQRFLDACEAGVA